MINSPACEAPTTFRVIALLSVLEDQHQIGEKQEQCTAPRRTLVRSRANVSMLTTSVNTSKVASGASRPRMMVLLVMNPMASTAGIVRLMLDSAVPSERLMER